MGRITDRTDLSDWLIHFVREPTDEAPEEYEGTSSPRLSHGSSAMCVLREIIEIGGLRPGHSFRRGKTSVYGGEPVVCFTEAPLHNFAQYVRSRGDIERCSPYGVCLLKTQVYNAGGRPVIYGLTGPVLRTVDTPTSVILDPSSLPLSEQYRYVPYDPRRETPLDWSHEREWRWKATPGLWEHQVNTDDYLYDQSPGLPIFRPRSEGGYFTRVGFIVRTREEALYLAKRLLGYADAKSNDLSEQFDPNVIRGAFVIPLEEAIARGTQRIEDLAEDLKVSATRATATDADIQRVLTAVDNAKRASEAAAAEYIQTHKGFGPYCGFAWIETDDTTSIITDALLRLKLAQNVTGHGYHVDAIGDIEHSSSMDYNEIVARAAADSLTADLGQGFYMHSRPD